MSGISIGKLEEGSYLVDLRGWMCPYPKYMLGPMLDKLPAMASRLVLIVDCPSAIEDVPIVAQSLGYPQSDVRQFTNGEWQITIEITRR